MKTAISIPDPIFHAAESLAKRLGMSRSELFSRALEAYLEAHKHDSVREALDAIYSQESSHLDETLTQMQWASLPKESW
jgi:metal-responsive CopG/Arc/MetJ family transcriptional regulator